MQISCAMPLRLLGASTDLNQMSFDGNFVSGKFLTVYENMCCDSSKKLLFWFYYKKKIFPTRFCRLLLKNIYNLGYKNVLLVFYPCTAPINFSQKYCLSKLLLDLSLLRLPTVNLLLIVTHFMLSRRES